MAVFKKYKGKRLNPKDKDWPKGVWYIWKRVNGRVIHRSLKDARTKEQAEQAERHLIETAFNRRFGILDNSISFDAFSNDSYRKYVKQTNVNLVAKDIYIRMLVKRFGKRAITEITPQDCRDAQYYFQRTPTARGKLSPASVNRIMSTLSRIFRLACEEGILDRNPMQYVKPLKEAKARDRLLTTEEKERLWLYLNTNDIILSRLVTLAVNLPMRRGQLLAITPDAIDFQNGLLLCTASKGRDSRVVPINSIALGTLKDMRTDGQLPFPLKDFRRRWHRALKNAGIENFRFHDLRKEFASELLRRNVNPNLIQKLFAHSSMAITNIYMHSEMDELKAAVNTLDATELQPTQEITGLPN